MRLIDLTGKRFERVVVIDRAGFRGKTATWNCRCDCGKDFVTVGARLRYGETKSCGCLHNEQAAELCRARETTHGDSSTKLYRIWSGMLARCKLPSYRAYRWYGGKGVRVCDEWQEFEGFRSWALANGYCEGLSIDRIDSSGNYEPMNCEWVTRSENSRRMHAAKRASA